MQESLWSLPAAGGLMGFESIHQKVLNEPQSNLMRASPENSHCEEDLIAGGARRQLDREHVARELEVILPAGHDPEPFKPFRESYHPIWNEPHEDFNQATWTSQDMSDGCEPPPGYEEYDDMSEEWPFVEPNQISVQNESLSSREVSGIEDADQSITAEDSTHSHSEPEQPRIAAGRKAPRTACVQRTLKRKKEDPEAKFDVAMRRLTRSSAPLLKSQDILDEDALIKDRVAKGLRPRQAPIKVEKQTEITAPKSKHINAQLRNSSKREGALSESFQSLKCRKLSQEIPKSAEALEVLFDGEWWEAYQVAERSDGSICVRYVGGSSSEDEWIPRHSARIRQSQDPVRMRRGDFARHERSSTKYHFSGKRPREEDSERPLQIVTRRGFASGVASSSVIIPAGKRATATDGEEAKDKSQSMRSCQTVSAATRSVKTSPTPEVPHEIIRKEEEIKKSFRAKGLDLRLNERVSVVNKKVDITLRSTNKFSRTLLLQNLVEGKNNLPNHIVEVLQIRSNGQDAKRPDSAIFGKPVTLHMMVKPKQRRGGGQGEATPSKVVIRFYKENLGSDGAHQYLIQFNAGGQWTSDQNIAILVVDIFEPFGVVLKDVNVRTESSLYSVSNTNTFPGHRINIQLLMTKLKKAGHTGAKLLGATGGVSMEFTNPQCKPQVQVTGTIYVPFCGEPRRARLTVLQLLLQFPETIQRT